MRTIAEKLVPAGYSEGMTMCLRTGVGARDRPAQPVDLRRPASHPTQARDIVSALCPTLANVADATQSARFLVSLLEPGAFAIALSRDGAITPLAGIETHPLLSADAPAAAPRATPSSGVTAARPHAVPVARATVGGGTGVGRERRACPRAPAVAEAIVTVSTDDRNRAHPP